MHKRHKDYARQLQNLDSRQQMKPFQEWSQKLSATSFMLSSMSNTFFYGLNFTI